ncbi:MAG: fumarate hydratase, partial [Candidatus Altiarchaeales archaeon]|nr:fumarate hydratase [Candidatus Altiarchaeales archaeon]
MFSDAVAGLIMRAETVLPSDVVDALEGALQGEEEEIARIQLDTILKNIRFAGEKKIPLCQDTGLLKFYVGFGSASGVDLQSVRDSLVEGVRTATREIPLRPNSVHPLTRKNSGDNTGRGVPSVELGFLPGGDYVEVTVFPKGAGSENMTFFRMLGSSTGAQG